jgi:hypothetical protein
VALGASLLITGGVAWRWAGWRWPEVVASSPASATPVRAPGAAWLAVLVGLLVVNEAGTRWWFARGAREHAAATRWTVALPESHWSFVADPLGDFAAEMLRPDFFTSGHWQGERNLELAAYYIEWRRGQVARFLPFAHNPTVCLPLSGCELVESLGQIDVTWRGLDIPFQAYRFNRRGEDLWVAFTLWDPVRARPLADLEVEQAALGDRTPAIRLRRFLPTSWIELELREGRNRQVRRMTAAVGLPTLRLLRVAIDLMDGDPPLDLAGLAPGQWRHVTPIERKRLDRLGRARSRPTLAKQCPPGAVRDQPRASRSSRTVWS